MTNSSNVNDFERISKDLIRESIEKQITQEDIKRRGVLKSDVADGYVTDIMALGYNNSSISLAIEDIFEIQSQFPWLNVTKQQIETRVIETSKKFHKEVEGFIELLSNRSKNLDLNTLTVIFKSKLN